MSCVEIGNTDTFQISQGEKHGCILSPLLFLVDLPRSFQGDEKIIKLNEHETFCPIIWADHLLSQPGKGLNRMLSTLNRFSQENLIEMYGDKT